MKAIIFSLLSFFFVFLSSTSLSEENVDLTSDPMTRENLPRGTVGMRPHARYNVLGEKEKKKVEKHLEIGKNEIRC